MNALKRISLSLTAHMNTLIDQIENHEAVAESVLEDIRSSLLSLKYQIKRIQNESAGFEKRFRQLQEQKAVWGDRARRLPESDHDRAVECVRRMKAAQAEAESVAQQRQAHEVLEKELTEQARKIEARFNELRAKQSSLAGRQSRAEAAEKIAHVDAGRSLDTVFDRWEKHILRDEASAELNIEPTDALAREFDEAEELTELEMLLTEIKSDKR